MSESANITSVEALSSFVSVVRAEQERASEVLATYIRELQRVVEWFEHDLTFLWKQELRKRYEEDYRVFGAFLEQQQNAYA